MNSNLWTIILHFVKSIKSQAIFEHVSSREPTRLCGLLAPPVFWGKTGKANVVHGTFRIYSKLVNELCFRLCCRTFCKICDPRGGGLVGGGHLPSRNALVMTSWRSWLWCHFGCSIIWKHE